MKVISSNSLFKHVMALTLDPRGKLPDGVVRCIVSREGHIAGGFFDISELHRLSGNSLESFEIGESLTFINEDEVMKHLVSKDLDFLGYEDPDIWIDEKKNLLHLYFTIPLIYRGDHSKNKIHLGHAFGKDLGYLEMTMPVLMADSIGGAKELSIAPVNRDGVRLNLVESSKIESDFKYSVVRVAVAEDMGKPWSFRNIAFHPKEHSISWVAGHASPGPLFSKEFIDVGEGKLLGLLNGREANKKIGEKTIYGTFSVGLFIYDYENGVIDWVSPSPMIQDDEAKSITFASAFVQINSEQGVIYAHVDDSFIRSYKVTSEDLRKNVG